MTNAGIWASERASELNTMAQAIGATANEYDWSDRAAEDLRAQAEVLAKISASSSMIAASLIRLSNRIVELQSGDGRQHADSFLVSDAQGALAARMTSSGEIDQLRLGWMPLEIDYGGIAWTALSIGSFLIPGAGWAAAARAVGGGAIRLIKVVGLTRAGVRATETYAALSKSRILVLGGSYLQASATAGTVWIGKYLGVGGRGWLAERVVLNELGRANPKLVKLPWPHKVVDLWDTGSRTITSIKSIDPRAATYVNSPAAFKRTLERYVRELSGWEKPTVVYVDEAGKTVRRILSNPKRELVIAVPSTGLKAEHMRAIEEILVKQNEAVINKVMIKVIEIE